MAALKNPKHERFAQLLAAPLKAGQKHLSGVEAYRKAGFTVGNGDSGAACASRLLANAKVAARVDELRQGHAKRAQMGADEVLRELSRIARGDIRNLFDESGNLRRIHELDDDTAATIASIEVHERRSKVRKADNPDEAEELISEVEQVRKVRAWDKLGALVQLAKVHGLFEKDNAQTGEAIGRSLRVEFVGAKKPRK